MSIGERIKKLRKTLDLTQQKFGERIGIKGNTVAQYELERSSPVDSVVSLICREFNVNEEWLRLGIGDMFLPENREDEIAKIVKSLLSDETNTFKSRFISMLAGLSVSDWERLESEARKLLNNVQRSEQELAAASPVPQKTVEQAEAEYIKSCSKTAKKMAQYASNTTADTINFDNNAEKASNQ